MRTNFRGTMTVVLLLITCGFVKADGADAGKSVLAPVTKRIQSFNDHDLESYLAAHEENVQIFEFPDRPIGVGRSHLRRIFGPLMEQGIGSIKVIHQVSIDNRVVSEEQLSYGGGDSESIVAIYTINRGLITSIYLVESARQ